MQQNDWNKTFPMDLNDQSYRERIRKSVKQKFKACTNPRNFCATMASFFPIISWLPEYDIREYLAADVVGGLTTGIMHVPQGIAYAVLAGVAPVYGLYTSFFPVLFYMLFGSFAVVALMSGVANDRISSTFHHANSDNTTIPYTPIEIVSTLTFTLGIVQFLTAILRLDFLMAYCSDQLVSGFATGAACHVLVAQLDDLMGVEVPKASGPGYIFKRMYDLAIRIPEANLAVVIISLCAIVFLLVGKEFISPIAKKYLKTSIPIPFELILVIIATLVSAVCNFHGQFAVEVVNKIPTGLPLPQMPRFELIPIALTDAAGIAVVTIAVHCSMAKMLAKRFNYVIDTRQELFALGFTDLLSGLFPVYPPSTTLGRTMVNLSSVFSCLLLLLIILWMGPLLQALPMCILAAIIFVSLKGMFEKFAELKTLWPVSKIDCSIWLVAFIATVAVDVMRGFGIAIVYALLTIILRLQWAQWSSNLSSSGEIIRDDSSPAGQKSNCCIYRFDAPILFSNTARLQSTIQKTVTDFLTVKNAAAWEEKFLIVDFTSVGFVDYMAITTLTELHNDITRLNVTVFYASVRDSIMRMLGSSGFFDIAPLSNFYSSVEDAIAASNRIKTAKSMNRLFAEESKRISLIGSRQSSPKNNPHETVIQNYSNGVEC